MSKLPEQPKAEAQASTEPDQHNAEKSADGGKPAGSHETQRGISGSSSKTTPAETKSAITGNAGRDAFGGKWQSFVPQAKINWNKLTDSELNQVSGVESRLTELVQKRYALTQDAANTQVKKFISRCFS